MRWILDTSQRRITPKSVALGYAFYKSKCMHIALMASVTPADGIMRHAEIKGWDCDTSHIFELGWRMATGITWNPATQSAVKEHKKVLFVVPHSLRALKRVNGMKDTKFFYYRLFKEIHLRKTELFDDNLGHVVFVLPSVEPRPGTWLPFVHAMNMWMAIGCRFYMIAGPRPKDEGSWYRVAASARSHVDAYLEWNKQYQMLLVDKLPIAAGAIDMSSPCCYVGVVEDENVMIAETQARMFYEATLEQLKPWVALEPLPTPRVAVNSVRSDRGHATVKEGRVDKRAQRRREQRKKRSEARAATKDLEKLTMHER
ncbi:unnamed protein product [Heligmosomoides polygyrus]|uniref:Uncharacterized protein n=1 Tax=Heligmosomoides polygyrus TaxID=6339 RepID=A0A183GTC1_HELPZ|nr:unnamed protein product [Heligmosomoides polygyrus]